MTTCLPLAQALVTGALAGLALSVPFGALSSMLIDTGMRSTRRVAAAAAGGVALTDFSFALAAGAAGASVTATLQPWERHVHGLSAAVLLALAAYSLVGARSPAPPGPAGPGSGLRACLRFVAVTAADPLTALTLATAASTLGSTSALTAACFALGCGLVSVSWHSALALGGNAIGRRLSPTARRRAGYAGAATTVALALHLAVSAA
ncbi:LysE family transporter [Motilibacter aurantiacus]|uniref:LysE family transporter n=1 Tax=Motilibacter aurantiacus TaxID=2714955 RepID=UPI00140D1FA7|nr:LysE family transporter [Motilibacter aurantiacus]NHC43822.1 LysE family transporter [Motilibacter aurantiacus]